jgi:hypothetical protein
MMQTKYAKWAGWILTILPALMLLGSAAAKLFGNRADLTTGFEHLGWSITSALQLGIIEAAAALIFLVPRTAVLGAVLVTGYMGGAMATHMRIGEPYILQFLIGVAVWAAIYLREPRVRAVLPTRR